MLSRHLTVFCLLGVGFCVSGCKHHKIQEKGVLQKKGEQAIELNKRALREAPDHFLMHLNLIKAYLRYNQPHLALSLLLPLLENYPYDPELYNLKGVALDLQYQHDEAQKAYQEGLKRNPRHRNLLKNYALSKQLMIKHD